MKRSVVIISALYLAAVSAYGQVPENPGFESGDLKGWSYFGKGWSVNSKQASEGTNSLVNAVLKGNIPELRGCGQKLKVQPGQVLSVSVDVSAVAVKLTPNSQAHMLLIFLDENGNMLRKYKTIVEDIRMPWQTLAVRGAVVPEKAVEAYIVLVVEVTRKAADGDWWRFDNLRVEIRDRNG